MTSPQPVELDTHDSNSKPTFHATAASEDQLERAEVKDDSLPPQDGGSGAWLFLFGACVFEIVSWGKYLHECPRVGCGLTCISRFPILMGSLPCPHVHAWSFRGCCLHLCSWSHVKCCIASSRVTNRAAADHCVQGLLQISMPFILYWLNYYPVQRKLTLWAGCILCFLSALGGAFATTVRLL